MKRQRPRPNPHQNRAIRPAPRTFRAPFIEHLHELRRRFFYIALSVIVWSGAAYAIEHQLVEILLKPSHGQEFVYTSPIGGVDFAFRLCLYTGLIFSIPVIVYQLLRYLSPLMRQASTRFIVWGSLASGLVAVGGVLFGYFVGLPAALHFLLHYFTTDQIHPMITVQSYMSFVMVYMVGSALMFQVPLLLIFINRIKPLKPSRLFHYERWVILIAFILAGLMNPTPRVMDQLLVAGPIILMYQVGIGVIAWLNRPRWSARARQLLADDLQAQAERAEQAQSLQRLV